jgi:hypothetical protein
MKVNSRHVGLLAALSLLMAIPAQARESGPFTMALQYKAPDSAESDVTLAPGIGDRPVKLSMAEGRTGTDPAVIGEISDHADKVFPLNVSNDAIAWANEALNKEAATAGIKTSPGAPLTLAGKLTRLSLVASTKAMGSTYRAEIQVAFTLLDARGRALWQGNAEGDATRYGKERSAENANEVLGDALREAYDNAFNDAGLQSAWLGKSKPFAAAAPSAPAAAPAAATAEAAVSPSELLADLVKQKTLTRTLSADDLGKWKNAGMPQEVIKAALAPAKG